MRLIAIPARVLLAAVPALARDRKADCKTVTAQSCWAKTSRTARRVKGALKTTSTT